MRFGVQLESINNSESVSVTQRVGGLAELLDLGV